MAESEDWSRGQALTTQSATRMLAGIQGAQAAQDADPSPHKSSSACGGVDNDDFTVSSLHESPVSTISRSWDPTEDSSQAVGIADDADRGLSSNTYRYTAASMDSFYASIPSQQADRGAFTFYSSPLPPSPLFTGLSKPSPMEFEDSPAGSPGPSFSRKHFQRGLRSDSARAQLLNKGGATSEWARLSGGSTPPPYTPGLPPRKKWWHWRPAWSMSLCLIFGLGCAIGHHAFYSSLNNKIADNQLAMLRYGTILAFATKASFVAAIVTAYRQRLWVTVRHELLSVGAVDSLFAATDDATALLNLETYRKAKLAMLLAVVVWLTPVVIILTSNTLLVGPFLDVQSTTCPNIRTLNFTGDELEDFRNPTKVQGRQSVAMNLWNTTMDKNESSPDWWDYYTGPNPYFTAAASLGIYSHQVIGGKNDGLNICGTGWNCTYSIDFVGPGYKCLEIANGVNSEVQKLGDNTAPFNTSTLLPKGKHSYYIQGTLGEYTSEQLANMGMGGHPLTAPPFPAHLGAFRLEPIIWGGYVVRANPDAEPPDSPADPGWDTAFVPKMFACENYETAYTVMFNFTGQDQSTKVVKREFLYPVMNTTYDPHKMANDGTRDNTTATPESNYVLPYPMSNATNLRRYRRVATFHSIGSLLRNAINGTIVSNPVSSPYANTNALQTKLINPRQEFFPYSNLQGLVQELYEDIILSMFSNKGFVSVVWAAKPWEVSGDGMSDDSSVLYPCEKSRWENRYRYVARDLWIVYSCAFLCALVAVVLGTVAVLENEGRLYDTRFSSIVAATRGPALEKVMWREDRGEMASDVKNLKVGYGVIHQASAFGSGRDSGYPERSVWEGGEVRYGFGLEGDVRQFKSEASVFRSRSNRM